MKNSKQNTKAYTWGDNCKGWHLVNTKTLSVIQEIMPPNTSEVEHKHQHAQQFFFILKGEATFNIEDKQCIVKEGEGIHIEATKFHTISNQSDEDVEFMVISSPHAHGDRILNQFL